MSNSHVNAFALSTDQQEILDTADRFAKEKLWPLQQRMDDEEWWPEDAMKQLASVGFLGVTAPGEYGGSASDFGVDMSGGAVASV